MRTLDRRLRRLENRFVVVESETSEERVIEFVAADLSVVSRLYIGTGQPARWEPQRPDEIDRQTPAPA
jgi:hypothetical protein